MTESVSHTRPRGLKPLLSGAFGNLVEWYDWGIFAVLSTVFSAQIFSSESDGAALLSTLATFAVGFAARPLGAIFLSPLGDRFGRKRLLAATVFMMGTGSLVIGLTPTYEMIGVLSPALFVLARVAQGISAGAEFQTGSGFVVEHAPPSRRGLHGSSMLVTSILGTLLATATGACLSAVLSEQALATWGWRIAFIFGAVLGAFGLVLRTQVPETPAFEAVVAQNEVDRKPLRTLFTHHRTAMLRLFAIAAYTAPYYLWTVYLPTYTHVASGLPLSQTYIGGIIALSIMIIAMPLLGALSDRIGRKPVLLVTPIGMLLFSYPALSLLQDATFTTFLIVDIIGCLLIAFTSSTMSAAFCELFPAEVRTTGIGIPYNVAAAFLGGTIPLISTALVDAGNGPAIAWAMIIPLAVFSIAVLSRMPEVAGTRLEPVASNEPAVGSESADQTTEHDHRRTVR